MSLGFKSVPVCIQMSSFSKDTGHTELEVTLKILFYLSYLPADSQPATYWSYDFSMQCCCCCWGRVHFSP